MFLDRTAPCQIPGRSRLPPHSKIAIPRMTRNPTVTGIAMAASMATRLIPAPANRGETPRLRDIQTGNANIQASASTTRGMTKCRSVVGSRTRPKTRRMQSPSRASPATPSMPTAASASRGWLGREAEATSGCSAPESSECVIAATALRDREEPFSPPPRAPRAPPSAARGRVCPAGTSRCTPRTRCTCRRPFPSAAGRRRSSGRGPTGRRCAPGCRCRGPARCPVPERPGGGC